LRACRQQRETQLARLAGNKNNNEKERKLIFFDPMVSIESGFFISNMNYI